MNDSQSTSMVELVCEVESGDNRVTFLTCHRLCAPFNMAQAVHDRLAWLMCPTIISSTSRHAQGWGEPTRIMVPWRQGFRHPTKNKCMGWFTRIHAQRVQGGSVTSIGYRALVINLTYSRIYAHNIIQPLNNAPLFN